MIFYTRQYYVLGVEIRDHVTANYQTHDCQARYDANNAARYTSWVDLEIRSSTVMTRSTLCPVKK